MDIQAIRIIQTLVVLVVLIAAIFSQKGSEEFFKKLKFSSSAEN